MLKDGKELEDFVGQLEEILQPLGATVTIRNEGVLDEVTGTGREVDVWIQLPSGEFIMIECRDRNTKEDVRWIEQLVTKGRDLGAKKVVAISTLGFYEPAKIKAQKYDIETRVLYEISLPDILNWYTGKDIEITIANANSYEVNIDFDIHPGFIYPDDINYKGGDKIFINASSGEQFSVSDLWNLHTNNPDFMDSLPMDGSTVQKGITVDFNKQGQTIFYIYQGSPNLINSLTITASVHVEQQMIGYNSIKLYETKTHGNLNVVSYHFLSQDEIQRTIQLIYNTTTDNISVHMNFPIARLIYEIKENLNDKKPTSNIPNKRKNDKYRT